MSDDLTPVERVGNTLAAIRENELEQLLADVRRIADGLGGFQELAVRLTPRPSTMDTLVLAPDEAMAVSYARCTLANARVNQTATPSLPIDVLAQLVATFDRRRHEL